MRVIHDQDGDWGRAGSTAQPQLNPITHYRAFIKPSPTGFSPFSPTWKSGRGSEVWGDGRIFPRLL